jgi:ketosteroid isomerase-like protein
MQILSRTIVAVLALAFAFVVSLPAAVIPSDVIPAALKAMADTERAFARRAAETNWRDAFLEYFAESAVSFQDNLPGPARDRLRKLPPPAPGIVLLWEPRVGDIASSGDLGWLTGPAVTKVPGKPERQGCYFSVWKKQPDGTFKVILDEGTNPPGKVRFAAGFVRATATARPFTPKPNEAPEQSLMASDRALGQAIAAVGAARAFGAVMHDGVRMHRNGVLPMTSKVDATRWLASSVKAMTSVSEKSESSAAGDLGYTWGKATVTGADGQAKTGYYVRLWTRGADGSWRLAADVSPH